VAYPLFCLITGGVSVALLEITGWV
jgi:hypothetical protein